MCERLMSLREAVKRWTSGFDAALLTASDAAAVVREAAAIKNMAAVVEGLAAARLAECSTWRREGDRSAAHQIARTTGTGVGAAHDAIATAQRLAELPKVAEAAKNGELSPRQVGLIADAASADPSAERRLVDLAGRVSVGELKDECARVKAAADPDLEAKRKRIHAERSLREYTGPDGVWNLHVRDNPEVGAVMMAAVNARRDKLFAQARKERRRERPEAYGVDALVSLVCEGGDGGVTPAGSQAKVIGRIDLDAWWRGYPVEGETCEIAGYGPVAVSAITDLVEAGAFVAAVMTKGEQVLGVAHVGRKPTRLQRSALEWLMPTCSREGCRAIARIQIDHRDDWARSKITMLDLLDPLCEHDHNLKTRDNWALVEGRGKRPMVPPADPSHPRHAIPKERPPPPRAA